MTLMDHATGPPTAQQPGTPAPDLALPSPINPSQRLPDLRGQTVVYPMRSLGAAFAEAKVHVELGLGLIRVARSQLLGGAILGIGMALLEQTVPDPRCGRMMNADLPLTLDKLI